VCQQHEQVNNPATKEQEEKNLMQTFIVEHYLNKAVDVYCGGPDVFKGTIEACADNVLTLNNEGKFTHVAIDKIIAIWAQ
jgi:hypothetical protein